MSDLAADVDHDSECGAVRCAPFVAEEGNDAGDLTPIHDRKGEPGVEPGVHCRRGAWRIALTGDVFDRRGTAGRPHSTHHPGSAGKSQPPPGGSKKGKLGPPPVPDELLAPPV